MADESFKLKYVGWSQADHLQFLGLLAHCGVVSLEVEPLDSRGSVCGA